MPKRIQLPSSEELFAEPGPRPGRGKPAPRTPPAPAPRRSRRVTTAPAGQPTGVAATPGPAPRRRRSAPSARPLEARLDRVEASLRDLPIDTLIDLRDGLEALLARGGVDADGVEHLLGSNGV